MCCRGVAVGLAVAALREERIVAAVVVVAVAVTVVVIVRSGCLLAANADASANA